MNKKTMICLLACALVGMPYAPVTKPAQADKPSQCLRTPQMVGAVTLVQLAYQGAFAKQGIPSAEGLIIGYNQGRITPAQIIDAAVKACILDGKYEFSTNKGYLEDMTLELRDMSSSR